MSTNGKHTILIVDDDPDFLFQYRVQLEAQGYDVIEAASRKEANERIATGGFDLAIIDLMMEEMDAGFRLCHDIKDQKPEVPVIMVTGVKAETGLDFSASTPEERSWIKADAMLAKPIRTEQLTREINRLLKD